MSILKWCVRCIAVVAITAGTVHARDIAADTVANTMPSEATEEFRLDPHRAEYKIKISVLGGRLTTELHRNADGYRAESSIEPTGMSRIVARGLIKESSDMTVSHGDLLPNRFQSIDTLSKDGQTVDLTFDREAKEVTGTIDGGEFETPIDGDVHDRVSLQYGLMQDLLRGIERDQYALQDAEELKLLSISRAESKTVKVPFGTFEAIGIRHQAKNSSRITTLWCVEELGFLPVVIEQHRKGKLKVRAQLTKYTKL